VAQSASILIDEVLTRVRDPQAAAHSRAFVLARLSDAQRFLNGALHLVISTATLTTNAYQQFYSVSGLLTTTLRPIGVRENGRDLATFRDLLQFQHLDLRWFRRAADRFEVWCPVGRDLLVVYPAKRAASSVTVIFAALTTALAAEQDQTEIPDEYLDPMLRLVEAMLLVKQRDIGAAVALLEQLGQQLGLDMTAVKWHLVGAGGHPGQAEVRRGPA
jgi:hypothetical protein